MVEFLYGLDVSIFHFLNSSIANPVFDVVMPFITDLNKTTFGLGLYGIAWLLLMWKGGRKGRILGLMLIPLIFMSDQLSSTLIKKWIERPRPCHTVNGIPVLGGIHLLVPCGSGYSFPSSHAVNNFAVGVFFSYYFRRWGWVILIWATMVAFSRISVGVHYPSDVLGGAVVGACCALLFIGIWNILAHFSPFFRIEGIHTLRSGGME